MSGGPSRAKEPSALATKSRGAPALAVYFELTGLPALPLLAFGFLLPNADLLWKKLRAEGAWGHLVVRE